MTPTRHLPARIRDPQLGDGSAFNEHMELAKDDFVDVERRQLHASLAIAEALREIHRALYALRPR